MQDIHPGANPPERSSSFESMGLDLHLSEWGDPARPALLLVHGFFDHGRGFDLCAPYLAEHYRVVALDSRGHGDSDWADHYSWPSDVDDILRAMQFIGGPLHLVGHSKGGGQCTDAAVRAPHQVRQLVNLDGFGPPPEGFVRPGAPDARESIPQRMAQHLDRRRKASQRQVIRHYDTIDEMVERRSVQNPRLSRSWLDYFVRCGARLDPEGYTWKADPYSTMGFGPWRPEWISPLWAHLERPMLAVSASEADTWGPLPDSLLEERLSPIREVVRTQVPGTGHFIHIEKPKETADLILDFLER